MSKRIKRRGKGTGRGRGRMTKITMTDQLRVRAKATRDGQTDGAHNALPLSCTSVQHLCPLPLPFPLPLAAHTPTPPPVSPSHPVTVRRATRHNKFRKFTAISVGPRGPAAVICGATHRREFTAWYRIIDTVPSPFPPAPCPRAPHTCPPPLITEPPHPPPLQAWGRSTSRLCSGLLSPAVPPSL